MIYSPEKLEKTIKKLSKLYDLENATDLFTLLPQVMESAEVRAKAYNVEGGDKKKEAVMSVILGIADQNSIRIDKDQLSVFINVIADASRGRYAINKE